MVSPSEPKNCAKIIHNNENTQAAKGGRTCLWGLRARCCQTYIFLKLDLKFVGGTNAVIERHLTTATHSSQFSLWDRASQKQETFVSCSSRERVKRGGQRQATLPCMSSRELTARRSLEH
jgi:hypothetical protein